MPFKFEEEPIPKKKRFEFVEEPLEEIPKEEPTEKEREEFFKRMGIRPEVTPLQQVTEYLTGKSPGQIAYESAVRKKPQERILAPLRGFLNYFENIGVQAPKLDIKGALEGKPLIPPTASEKWRVQAEEGLFPEEIEALRKSEVEGMIGIDLLMGGLGRQPLEPVKETIKKQPLNPIQRKIAKLDNIIKRGATEGERAAAQAAKDRLTGKYDVGKGIEKIAKKEGISISDAFKRIWDATKKWGKKKFGRDLTPQNMQLEETEKFLEYTQRAEEKGLSKIELKPITPRFELEVPKVEKPPIEPAIPPKEPSKEEPALPSKMDEATNKYFSKMAAKFDVESPFKKVGAPETGFAVKNYYDRINFHIEKGKEVVKKIKKLDLSPEEISEAILAAERAEIPKNSKIAKARDLIRKYMDTSLADLKKEGVLKKGFYENIVSGLEAQIEANKELMKGLSTRKKRKLFLENRELQKQINEMKGLRFVSIPVRELFEAYAIGNPDVTKRVVKYLTKKRRKTLTIQDLIDSGAIAKKDLTLEKIIGSYSKKLGRDMALAKIINAGRREGLVSTTDELGMVKIPGYIAPELAKYYVSPAFADFIQGYTNPKSFSNWEKFCNRLKGWSFYNPGILGFNNLWQQLFAVLGQPQHLLKLGQAWKQAVIDVAKKTPNYWEAFENGIRSSPMVFFEKSIKDVTKSLKKDGPNPLLTMINAILKYPKAIHEKLYDSMQTVAWVGFDMIPRMATYNWLRSLGLNARDAAQMAARIHGDYASVPAELRRKLNKFLYVPTFPIVMTKNTIQMLKSSGKVAKISYERAKGEKKEKIDPKTKAEASQLIGATIILGAAHLTMKALGFDTVFPLWHYKRDYRDREGKLKTQHFYLSFPITTLWKQIGRIYEVFGERGVENRIWRLVKRLKLNLSIPIQIAWEIAENSTRSWKNVYDPRAPAYEQAMDTLAFIAKRALPLLGLPLGERFTDPVQKEEMIKEFGWLINMVPSMFTFKTDTDRRRAKIKANRLKRKMQWLKKKKKLTPKELENYKREIKKLKEIK